MANEFKSYVELGRTGRNSRFKYDDLDILVRIYDEDKTEDSVVQLYVDLLDDVGTLLRKELGVTYTDIHEEIEGASSKD